MAAERGRGGQKGKTGKRVQGHTARDFSSTFAVVERTRIWKMVGYHMGKIGRMTAMSGLMRFPDVRSGKEDWRLA